MLQKPTYKELEQRVKELEKESVERKRVDDATPVFKRKNDDCFPVSVSPSSISDNKGNINNCATVKGITERKLTEEALRESEEFTSSLLENSPTPILVVSEDTSVKYANPAFEELTGYSSAEITGKKPPYPWWTDSKSESLSDRKKYMFTGVAGVERVCQKKNGEPFWVELTITPIIRNGEYKYTLTNWVDITTRKLAEEALSESEQKYRAIFEQAGDSIVLVDTENGALVEFNEMAHKTLGYTSDEFKELKISDIDVDRSHEELLENIKRKVQERLFKLDSRHKTKDGKIRNVQITGKAINIHGKNFNLAIWNDITDRKQVEQALKESENRYRTLFETAADVILVRDLESNYFSDVNNVACESLGYSKKELLQMTPGDIVHPDYVSLIPGRIEDIRKRGPVIFESAQVRRDGKTIPIEVSQQIIEYGERPAVLSIIRDISERKQAEEQIKTSLKEKEILLSEIHHRVKNNMQLISSLLKIQSDKIPEKEYADMFKDSLGRIRSMTLVHEKLYRSEDFANVDFNGYVKSLVNSLFRSYGIDTNKIALKIEVEGVSLGVDTAVPCGLLINELVSNSLKYAFPEDRRGEISITLRSINEEEFELIVNDNGIGIPEGIDFRNTESFGMELISILAEDQLEGQIELD